MIAAQGRDCAQVSLMTWLDVSVPLRDGMLHWPGDPPVGITRVKDIDKGNSANLSLVSMGVHSGTHVDVPVHFIADGKGVDEVELSALVGRARVIEIRHAECITVDELRQNRVRRGERILFKTRNSSNSWYEGPFNQDFVYLSDEAAQYLVDRGVRLAGADYLSMGSYRHGGRTVHRLLLSSGAYIVEGLNLFGIAPGIYDMVCLPLKLVGGDGAPARAILRPVVSTRRESRRKTARGG